MAPCTTRPPSARRAEGGCDDHISPSTPPTSPDVRRPAGSTPAQKAEISRHLDEALAWLKQTRAKFDAALERRLAALAQTKAVAPAALKYLSRLSDLLFVMCRAINRALGHPDVLWKPMARS